MNSKPATQKILLTLSPQFEEQYEKLNKGARTPVAKKLEQIRKTSQLPKIEALSVHLKGLHRFRVGNLRVLVEIDFVNNTILAIGIEHRGVVYKQRR